MLDTERYRDVESWTSADLASLPESETDLIEFKSSTTPLKDLSVKIQHAASAFWNTGGGFFIAGLDKNGDADGGLSVTVGRQDLRDWVDQAIAAVMPRGPYAVKLVTNSVSRGSLASGKAILVIAFGPSTSVPHMAPDHRYYIRAGAHTVPASHYIVEAIRALRGILEPRLEVLITYLPGADWAGNRPNIEFLVLALTGAPALDITVQLASIPGRNMGFTSADRFPTRIPAVTEAQPFRRRLGSAERFQNAAFSVSLEYSDTRGRRYELERTIDVQEMLGPIAL